MCGFVGFTHKNEQQLKKAQTLIGHRGPDSQGSFFNESISLGHNRLSIIDLSEKGQQPMSLSDGNLTIVFNGEIYNYQKLKVELEKEQCRFLSNSDTEVILQGYAKWGTQIFSRLRGMWALVIFDKTKNELIMSRDHFGIKPLYYSDYLGSLSFASELKVFRMLLETLTPNKEAYWQFFNFGYFVDPQTCYQEVKKLAPGKIARYKINSKEIVFEDASLVESGEQDYAESFSDAVEVLDKVLLDSVQAHYVSDVPVGLLLSGGNDSSLLAALSVALGKKPIAYNLNIQNSLDSKYARKVAKQLGLELREAEMDLKLLEEQYEKIWQAVDEPTADSSVIPTSLVYSTIAKDTKVVLSGEGGDEMFGGYRRHEFFSRHQKVRESSLVFSILNSLQRNSKFSLQYANPIITRLRNAYLSKFDDIISAYLSQASLLNRTINEKRVRALLSNMIRDSRFTIQDSNNLFFDRTLYLPNDLMYKNDIASMASSIEARVPFLDKVLYNEVSRCIKPEFCLSEKYQGKLILKKVMDKYLPHDLIYRPKKGFSFSFQKYQFKQFYSDLEKSLQFHFDNADDFGIGGDMRGLLKRQKTKILIKKFPTFAFALVSNWRIFR